MNPTFTCPHDLTVEEEEGYYAMVKHNLSKHKVDINLFKVIGDAEIKYGGSGGFKWNYDGGIATTKFPYLRGIINPCFYEKHKWTSQSCPHEFIEPLIPFKNTMIGIEYKKEETI